MSSYIEFILNWPALFLTVWGLLALLAVLIFLRKPRTIVLVSSKDGRLQISRHALNRLIEACCEQLKGVAAARARVIGKAGKFNTFVRLKVRPEAKLDAIHGYLTQEIAEIYRQNLGIENKGSIEIEVTGVASEIKF